MFSDYSVRWGFLGISALIVAAWLGALQVAIDVGAVLPKLQFAGVMLFFSAVFTGIESRLPTLRRPFAVVADLSLSVVQVMAATTVLLPLTYLAATTGFPLLDDALARLDAMLGFDWDAAARWVGQRPMIDWVLGCAYASMPMQAAAVLLIGSLRRPGDRNGEAVWLLIVSLLITCAIFAFTPALGKIGHVGTGYLNILAEIRGGSWSVLSFDRSEGIVTFPSFHTALAIIFIYIVRHDRWALAVFAPLNILMILSTPTIGGHYLVDLFGGAAVAIISILAVHALRQHLAERPFRDGPDASMQPVNPQDSLIRGAIKGPRRKAESTPAVASSSAASANAFRWAIARFVLTSGAGRISNTLHRYLGGRRLLGAQTERVRSF
jgi:membrane-associated phospholipid phosphatase